MAPKKRAVSTANVQSRRTRMKGDVDRLLAQEDALQLQRDIEAITSSLAGNAEKVRAVKAFLRLDDQPHYDSQTHLNPDMQGRQISRIPITYLCELFEQFTCFTKAQLRALVRADGKSPLKMLYMLAVVPPTFLVWTTEKALLTKYFNERMDALGQHPTKIIWDTNFQIDWNKSGLYKLEPPWVPGTNPAEHTYSSISCLGHTASLVGVVTVKADWTIKDNFSLAEAELFCPTMSGFKPKCYSFFMDGFLPKLAAPAPSDRDGQDRALQNGQDAIDDDKSVRDSTCASEEAVSPVGGKAMSAESTTPGSKSSSGGSAAAPPPPPAKPSRAQVAADSCKA
eukprot:6456626-Amphidinium_carterae.1